MGICRQRAIPVNPPDVYDFLVHFLSFYFLFRNSNMEYLLSINSEPLVHILITIAYDDRGASSVCTCYAQNGSVSSL